MRSKLTITLLFSCIFPLFLSAQTETIKGESWADVQKNKSGVLTVLHFDRRPFVYMNEMGKTTGIGYGTAEEFARYVQSKYNIEVHVQWIKYNDYPSFIQALKTTSSAGVIGVSSMSVESDLEQGLQVSSPFLKGIDVIASHKSIKTADTKDQIKEVLKGKTALTTKDSNFEKQLNAVKGEHFANAKIVYIEKPENLAEELTVKPDHFAYVPLSDYYVQLKQGKELNRQNYLEVPHKGYAFSFNDKCDWQPIMKEFFSYNGFKGIMNFNIKKHLGTDANDMIWEETSTEDVGQVSETDYANNVEEDAASLRVKLKEELEFERKVQIFANIAVFALILVAFLYWRKRRMSHKEITTKAQKIQAQEEYIQTAEERISEALHYGYCIQQVAWSRRKPLEELCGEAFIYSKPRAENISGDFYWYASVGDKTVIVVGDSTARNIAAAFVSIKVDILLNRIVQEDKTTDPSKIMAELHQHLSDRILHSETDFLHKDGLEIGIATIDRQAKQLSFVGAKNSAYHVSKGSMTNFRGKKLVVGMPSFRPEELENQVITYESGDVLYMATDGMQDQLGYDKQKYMVKRFREFLVEIHQQSLYKQEVMLDKEFMTFKGTARQTDDIVVIGIKLP